MFGGPRPIRLLCASATGTVPDVAARDVAIRLGRLLEQPIVVENKPGAGGAVMARELRRAAPDGQTLGATIFSFMSVSPSLYKPRPFDPLSDFSHVGIYTHGYFVLAASPDSPVRSVADMVDAARRDPLGINVGTAGVATPGHLLVSLLAHRAGFTINHVPFKGSAGVVQAGVNREVPVISDGTQFVLPQLAAGRLRALAVLAPARLPDLPTVPTLAEVGLPSIEQPVWHGIVAPPGLPPDVLKRIDVAVAAVCDDPDYRHWTATAGRLVQHRGPAAMREQVAGEVALWEREVRRANIEPS
jgi:tripartite-type tricarboxylate transporter receptor subunit TctC